METATIRFLYLRRFTLSRIHITSKSQIPFQRVSDNNNYNGTEIFVSVVSVASLS